MLLCHLIDLQEEHKPQHASRRLLHIQSQILIVVVNLVYILIFIALGPPLNMSVFMPILSEQTDVFVKNLSFLVRQ